jgi:transglutaminase-like putative cysteine protease
MTPIASLPDEALLFLLSSRYCDSDKLADFAWARFGKISGGYRRVRAICDFVHAKIRFGYPDARSTRCASDSMQEAVGVCRDFAHLAIALCRRMNIPAR